MIDGPTLREVRGMAGLTLRKVAEAGKMGHGHLSKVERGEAGRPVTPAILRVYEKACGVDLAGGQLSGLRPGQLTEGLLRRFAGRVGAVAAGGAPEGLGDGNWADLVQLRRFLRARRVPEAPVDEVGLSALAQVTDLLAGLDGVVAGQVAGQLLPWVVDLLDDAADDKLGDGMRAVLAELALRAGRAAVELDGQEVARSLYLVALYHARQADESDLGARAMAGIAEQHVELGHYRDAVNTCRLGEVDERISEAIRELLSGIRARALEQERRVDDAVRVAIEDNRRDGAG